MSKKLLSSFEITPLLETVEKDLPHLVNTNEDDGDLKDESASSTPCAASSYLFTSNITLVMVINATTLEEQIASLTKAIEGLTKHVQEQDSQITKLMSKVDNVDASRIIGKQVELHDKVEMLIPVLQLKEFIMGTIKDRFDGSSKSSLTYAKPYTKMIDNLKMTIHMTHFIETYNDAGTYGDYLWKKEPIIDYINHWRNLSLNCKDRLSEASTIEMCIQEIHWGLRYIIRKATHLERYKAKKGGKSFPKTPNKESMAVNATPIKFKGNTNDKSGEKKDTPQEMRQRKLTLKEMQAKQYPFLDSNIFGIFDDLLKANLIELLEINCPEEAGCVDNPEYCKYHYLVGHPIHDCFIFKDKEDNATANLITIKFGSIDVIMENVPRSNDGGKLDYYNNISCNMTSEQKISSNEVCLFKNKVHNVSDDCVLAVTFTDEDLLLSSKSHNRPLFITGYTHKQKVNIFPLRTLKELGICMDELANMLDDDKPFTEIESHFTDAKYYLEDAKKIKAKDSPSHEKSKQQDDGVEGRSSVIEVGHLKELVLPLTKFDAKKPSLQLLEGFVCPTQGVEIEHGVCIEIQNAKCFDIKTYKLLVIAGYNPKKMLKESGHIVQSTRIGLEFVPQNPIRIAIKRANTNHVSEGEFSSTDDANHQRLAISKTSKYLIRVSKPRTTQKLQSLIPSHMRRCSTLLISCEKMLKVELQTIIFSRTQDDEDDRENVASSYHINIGFDREMKEKDAEAAPPELEECIKATIDELKEINLGDVDSPRPIYISALLVIDEERAYIKLLHEFKDVFAWSYKEMPGLDLKVAVHHLSIKKGACPLVPLIEAEVNKLIEVGFIRELTIFRTPKDIYCYKVMPFRLKNTRATYQKAMQKIFDDMLIKILNLRKVLERLRRYQLKMNLLKCTFGVKSGKFLEFIVDAILNMPEPQDIHKLKILQGKLAYLRRNAFKRIKTYLMKSPMLVALVSGCSLILYIAPQERSVRALLAQENNDRKESVLYYLSRMMTPNELKYSPIEKICLTFIFTIQNAEVIFVTFDGEVLPYSFTLTQNCLNNITEYQALILGLEMTVDIKQLHLKVYGDSKLVVNQLFGLYEVKKPELLSYFNYARRLIGWLGDVLIEHIPMTDNKQVDALANLASTLAMPEGETRVPICRSWVVPQIFENENRDEDEKNHVFEVFEYEKLLDDPRQRVDIRHRATHFIHYKSTLYRCSFDGVFLRCLGDDEAIQAIEEAHSRICDCMDYVQRCQAYVVGPMTKSFGGHLYILAAIDYFSKWAEAIPLKEVKKKNIADFIYIDIIYRYFQTKKSSMYYAAANGLTEAFNKTLCTSLKKVIAKEALWAYKTIFRMPTQATLYALVYDVEVIVHLEQQIPSLRIAVQEGLTEEKNVRLCLEELEALDEKRLEAQQRLECYQTRLSRAFNKKVPSTLSKLVYTNGAYKLVTEDGLRIGPINGKFLKRYYA
ncbi:hypothetical protein Pfo_020350 [Paulownia fortunei]|nr:hypothetical protein Pfo_020350 [Paulownia fortunei]